MRQYYLSPAAEQDIEEIVMYRSTSPLSLDPHQLLAAKALEKLHLTLYSRESKVSLLRAYKKIKGIYIWGKVGRGKTFLVNTFFEGLTTEKKMKVHYQVLMKHIHERLFPLLGQKEALTQVAHALLKNIDVLVLDEFYVEDIGDAMLLKGLLDYLHKHHIVLVITSNTPPDALYLHGINRQNFLPAIDALKQHLDIMCLAGDRDYRLTCNLHNDVFFFGKPIEIEAKLFDCYQRITHAADYNAGAIHLNGQTISFKARQEGVIWFDFKELFEKPRSYRDYLNIAEQFHTILVSDIPQLDNRQAEANLAKTDRTRRFISFIDEIYNRAIRLIAGFETPLNQLYLGEKLQFLFARTHSRLVEMQSQAYRPHTHNQ